MKLALRQIHFLRVFSPHLTHKTLPKLVATAISCQEYERSIFAKSEWDWVSPGGMTVPIIGKGFYNLKADVSLDV